MKNIATKTPTCDKCGCTNDSVRVRMCRTRPTLCTRCHYGEPMSPREIRATERTLDARDGMCDGDDSDY